MTLRAIVNNQPISKSGHLNTYLELRQTQVGGGGRYRIRSNATPRTINNIEHIVGESVINPVQLDSEEQYPHWLAMLVSLKAKDIDFITIHAVGGEYILGENYYSTSEALNDAGENRLHLESDDSDDLIIISRDAEGGGDDLFLTWGTRSVRRTAGVGVKVQFSDLVEADSLYHAIYRVFEKARREDWIDLDLSTDIDSSVEVLVAGHVVRDNKYNQIIVAEHAKSGIVPPVATKAVKTEQPKTIENQKETKVMKTTLAAVLAENKAAAINAGEMETGRLVVNRIVAVVKKRAPLMVKGYIDTPVGRIAVANLFATLVREYLPDNALAGRAADGAVKSAAYEVLRDIDIPAMLEEVLDGFKDAAPKEEEQKIAL